MKLLVLIGGLFLTSALSFAGQDKAIDDAMKDTQDLLKSKSKRQEVFNRDAKAKAADDRVQALTGGNEAQSQKFYDISSDAFAAIMKGNNNDPQKVMEMLQKAQTNPEAFYNSLPPDIRGQIRGIAGEIEKKDGVKNSP